MRIIQLCPASYMLLNEYILHFYNTEKIERKIKQAKRHNNWYPATHKDQQTFGYKSLHYKRKVDYPYQLANKTKITKQTQEEIITDFTNRLYYLYHIFIPAMW